MKKDIKELEDRLKTITGEDNLPKGELVEKSKKSFSASAFTRLAEEVRKILEEDAKTPIPALKR